MSAKVAQALVKLLLILQLQAQFIQQFLPLACADNSADSALHNVCQVLHKAWYSCNQSYTNKHSCLSTCLPHQSDCETALLQCD